jgi:hypothetical protein
MHTVLTVVLWLIGWVPSAVPAFWLSSAHGWPTLIAIGVFITGWVSTLAAGQILLFVHAELREEAATSALEPGRRRREFASALKTIGALSAVTAGGMAVVVGFFYVAALLADLLHHTLNVPDGAANPIASIATLSTMIAVAVLIVARFDRIPADADAASLQVPDAGVAVGQRRRDPLRVEDVESATGRRVRTLFRTSESAGTHLDFGAEHEIWEFMFAFKGGQGVHCAVYGHEDSRAPTAAKQARTYRRRRYREVERLTGPGDEAAAATAPGSHCQVWAHIDRRWSITITVPLRLGREAALALLRSGVDRMERLIAAGELPVPPAIAPSERAARLPVPLREDDFTSLFGRPADPPEAVEAAATDPSQSDTGWWDGYWCKEFSLRGKPVVDVGIHWIGDDTDLLAASREAWTALGPSRSIKVDGCKALLIEGASPFEHPEDRRSLWAAVGDRWAMDLVAAPRVSDVQLAGLAAVIASRLGE